MIKNLQDELSQLENKQAKSAKFCNNTLDWRGQKMLENWKTGYAKSNNIWIIYTDDTNQNILAA